MELKEFPDKLVLREKHTAVDPVRLSDYVKAAKLAKFETPTSHRTDAWPQSSSTITVRSSVTGRGQMILGTFVAPWSRFIFASYLSGSWNGDDLMAF